MANKENFNTLINTCTPVPLDLSVLDLPHRDSNLEWWYLNAHITTETGDPYSLFVSFFKLIIGKDEASGQYRYAHTVIWGLTDVTRRRYIRDAIVDHSTPSYALSMMEGQDKNPMRSALMEVFRKGKIPLPDRFPLSEIYCCTESLHISIEHDELIKTSASDYQLSLHDAQSGVSCNLLFSPQVGAILHGEDGLVKGPEGRDMYYYFVPKCAVSGHLKLQETAAQPVSGYGWYDHEFSLSNSVARYNPVNEDSSWNWLSAQLNNDWQLSVYELYNAADNTKCFDKKAIIIDPDGNAATITDFSLTVLEEWVSARTFITYPVSWLLEIAAYNIRLEITADIPQQEFMTILAPPAFWEGRVSIKGVWSHRAVSGLGFFERKGFNKVNTVSSLLKEISRVTLASLDKLLPADPDELQYHRLITRPANKHFLNGVDKAQFIRTIVLPIREMINRTGKCWRSYAVLLCIDLVGGNSQDYLDWLILPELLHTGSLIVDDVQDNADMRRGGPSCHKIYGNAIAINAGNACYFIWQLLFLDNRLPDSQKLQAYEMYFDVMRAVHAGQAMDIDGVQDLMPQTIMSGNSTELERRILAIHRLKSAVPARMLAELGAMVGGATSEQIGCLGHFFEVLGIAFQIMDDVLDLRGFENNIKIRGGDIRAGKISFPVAKCFSLLVHEQRTKIWHLIASKPTSVEIVNWIIEELERSGGVEAANKYAYEIIEATWQKLDALFPDSEAKIRLRSFSQYLLQRQY